MNYATTLKKLIDLSGLTAKYIANYIGYDNSYVSKWTTGKNIPSPKMHYYINSRLSELFAGSIHGEKSIDSLSELFERKVLLISKDLVRTYILRLLQDSYFVSANEFDLNELVIKDRDVFIEWDEILEGIRNILNTALVKSSNEIRILTTNPMNFNAIVKNDIHSIFYITRDIPVKYNVIIDDSRVVENIESLEAGILMILQFGIYDMEVVLVPEKVDNTLIIIENEVALLFEYIENTFPKVMTSTTDNRIVEAYASSYNNIVKNSKTIIKSSKSYATEFDTVRRMVLPGNEVFIYSSFLSGLLLPDNLANHLFNKHKIPKSIINHYYEHKKLYHILFENTNVKFVFSEDMLHEIILSRKIDFCGKIITLTADEMKIYIEEFRSYLMKLDQIEFFYYHHNRKGPFLKFSDNRVTVIADKKNTLFVRDLEVLSDYSMRNIAFDHPEISNYFFEHLKSNYIDVHYKKITHNDVCDILDRSLLFL